MTKQQIIKKVTDVAEGLGWSVDVDKQDSCTDFTFQNYTAHEQDFFFNATMDGNKVSTLAERIFDYYDDFDPDYEAYQWIGSDGHGMKGAPYHIKDIVEDMEEAENSIWDLYCALQREFNL